MLKDSERLISIFFSENFSPFPFFFYNDVSDSELLLSIKECITNLLLSCNVETLDYNLFDRHSKCAIEKCTNFNKIKEIVIKFNDNSILEKLDFLKNDLYAQNEQKEEKIPASDLIKGNNSNEKQEKEDEIKEREIIKENLKEKEKHNPIRRNHPFNLSGNYQTVSEIGNDSIFFSNRKGALGYFSFFHGDPVDPPPLYMKYDTLKKTKGVEKKDILFGLEKLASGELKCVDKEILDKQKGLIGEMLKKIMQSIAEGRGIVGVSLPVRIFEPRSLLERIVDWWTFAPGFLGPAAFNPNPIERFEAVIAFSIAGLYVSVSQVKPFNPILGETYQATFADGTEIYCEHTSHHPPISNFLIVGKGFRFYGRYEYIAKGNTTFSELKMTQDGPNIVEFTNFKEKIVFNLPCSKLSGLMGGDRTLKWCGIMSFLNQGQNLKAVLKIGSDKKVAGGGIFAKKISDSFEGKVYTPKSNLVVSPKKKDKQKDDMKFNDLEKEIASIEGSWLEKLIIGGKEVWNINKFIPQRQMAVLNPLPSDCRFREDLIFLKYNNLPMSEKWKLKLEVRQRFEKKIRMEGNKKKK